MSAHIHFINIYILSLYEFLVLPYSYLQNIFKQTKFIKIKFINRDLNDWLLQLSSSELYSLVVLNCSGNGDKKYMFKPPLTRNKHTCPRRVNARSKNSN